MTSFASAPAHFPPFEWPTGLLIGTLVVLILAVFVPWIRVARGRFAIWRLAPALIATLLWRFYEYRLKQVAPVGDPLIRVDLLIILPLICTAWLSGLFGLAAALLRHRE